MPNIENEGNEHCTCPGCIHRPLTDSERLDQILKGMQKSRWTLGSFLKYLFEVPVREDKGRSQVHSQMVSAFLGGRTKVQASEIVELMYSSKDSAPKAARTMTEDRPASEKKRPDAKKMARWHIQEWAIQKVESIVDKESAEVSNKKGGLHFSGTDTTWEFIHNFSLGNVMALVEEKAPTLLRLLVAAAIPVKKLAQNGMSASPPGSSDHTPYATHFSKPLFMGSGFNRQDPFVILLVACILLMCARNLRFSTFRNIVGLWLFANTASHAIYAVLNRIGLSSSYTSTLKLLRKLSRSSQETIRQKAPARAFLLIYDNINRMQRAWDPDLGQKDQVNNGTAATFVEVADCDPQKAFNVQALEEAHNQRLRDKLTADVLLDRIDMTKMKSTFALHTLRFLTEEVPILQIHQDFINLRFRTTLSTHRMREGRKTTVHPLATSDYDEGNTTGQRNVFDDLNLKQLGLEKEEVAKLLEILGGDQASVEKARTLKKFLADCPHGYARYGWVLPLIQLWHMGWADLERVLSTHWGNTKTDSESGDISSFCFTNSILRGKVKNVKRPDYYPSQRFVFDNLRAEIIDCWKVYLGVDDLQHHFEEHPTPIEDLLKASEDIVARYMTTEAAEHASRGDTAYGFPVGTPWTKSPAEMDIDSELDKSKPPLRVLGDWILSNTILRLRDSMLHFEFQFAVAEGDIGRAMNVMAVWVFTFTGCGKSKYSNELLELACNFEYEYSDALQEAILNNWLCNLTGIEGCWFPMDLLQEHNIKQLKKMSMRRDAQFGGSFFKEIIAYNIRAFLQSIESMKTAVRLTRKGGSHRRKVKSAAMKELGDAMTERELHKLRPGRVLGHVARDDFETGFIALAEGPKIKDFLHRTLLDAGNVNGDEEDVEMLDVDEAPDVELELELLMPSTVMGGSLVLGDENTDDDEDTENHVDGELDEDTEEDNE